MSVQKPSIPKGTRDFSPDEMVRRNFIFDSIREVFQLFGYLPIETPAMENLSTLLGKYGEEGDKLLFRILNSGDFLDGVKQAGTAAQDYREMLPLVAEKGLRYDLTVPFARFVVQHQNELAFPFKRYQIQPVWRADRPQKGRYREFFQCDVDVIGSDSLLNETELIQIIDTIFSKLGINVVIRLNNRKILAGIAETIGESSRLTDLTIALDKHDKIGPEKVREELLEKGFGPEAIEKLQPLLKLEGTTGQRLEFLEGFLKDSPAGKKGLEEVRQVMEYLSMICPENGIELDLRLARGLNYYTGTIIEVNAGAVAIGSICGGGRYDDLTGIFGLPGVSGVGVSFGADRIYDVMKELNLFPGMIEATTKVLFMNFGRQEEKYCLPLLADLRNSGIPAELFPDPSKLKKQLDYANRRKIPFVVLVGENEMKEGKMTLKDMQSGEQISLTMNDLKLKMQQ